MKVKRLALAGLLVLFAASVFMLDRGHMTKRIEAAGNSDFVYRFLPADATIPETYDEVPLQALLPAFILSELNVAFLIGSQILAAVFVILALFWGIYGISQCLLKTRPPLF